MSRHNETKDASVARRKMFPPEKDNLHAFEDKQHFLI